MKYIIILGDGMADYPVPELGNKTPLQAAGKPGMDYIARNGKLGLVKTIPGTVSTGSDTANMSVLGFDPEVYYTGRAPIEAVSMGLALEDGDIAYRCNLVNLSGEGAYGDLVMADYSSDEISSEEASILICDVNRRLYGDYGDIIRFYPGISYRHCMVWRGRGIGVSCTPPHDILTRRVGGYLPYDAGGSDTYSNGAGDGDACNNGAGGGNAGNRVGVGNVGNRSANGCGDAAVLRKLMSDSFAYLSAHEVNLSRVRRGLLPANSLWLWGQGGRLALSPFKSKYGLSGAVISAVDLIKGIGIAAGLRSIDVEGATGTLNTNYLGKAEAALAALDEGFDFVFVHVEAPDECGHRREIENKVKSIEYIDEKIVSYLLERLGARNEDFSVLLLPDHATPLSLRTHTRDPVPFAIYRSDSHTESASVAGYDEAEAAKTGLYVDPGHTLMDLFIK